MMHLFSVGLICGFAVGVQYEQVEDNHYVIVSLGIFDVVIIW
jgi:hypothetical protein